VSTIASPPPALAVPSAARTKAWLVGPWFDALFLANLAWPIIVLAAYQGFAWLNDPLTFLQVYFLSSPHRWITLVLVFCDRDRFAAQPWKFGGLAAALVVGGLALVGVAAAIPSLTDSLMLLMMVDYVWNAWHFAAQHAGIARIYGRMSRADQPAAEAEFEKAAIRSLVLWVFLRVALYVAAHGPYADNVAFITPYLPWLDPVALIPAMILLVREWRACWPGSSGRVFYITSVVVHYTAQLAGLWIGDAALIQGLFLASAVFHAVEYLAICGWSVQKKTTGIWRYQITRTGVAVLAFMTVLGVVNLAIAAQSAYVWALITLLVSLLHYAYDGIIWKARPKPQKA
jgi:hypothetical protein